MTEPALSCVAVLAGGLGTRLKPHTEKIPKALVEVAGEPFVAHQLRLLKREGMRDVVLCLGHLGEQVTEFVGDGSRFGLAVKYSFDGDRLLGTGGALRKASALLGDAFFILYGDSYLDTKFSPVAAHFRTSGAKGLMTVFRNDDRWDQSNVVFRGDRIERYSKTEKTPDMHYIDYGLGILRQEALAAYSGEKAFDLAEVYQALVARGELAGYEVKERFYEIGSQAGLEETAAFIRAGGAASAR